MPKSSANESLATPATCASSARWYSGCAPIWYGHQTAGWRMRSPGPGRVRSPRAPSRAAGRARSWLNGISVPSRLIEPTSSTTCVVAGVVAKVGLDRERGRRRGRARRAATTCASRSETGAVLRELGCELQAREAVGRRRVPVDHAERQVAGVARVVREDARARSRSRPSRTRPVTSSSSWEYAPCSTRARRPPARR